jgi:hypothetical protein
VILWLLSPCYICMNPSITIVINKISNSFLRKYQAGPRVTQKYGADGHLRLAVEWYVFIISI